MEKQTISQNMQNVYNPIPVFKKKSLLFSSDDPERLAQESSRARLIRDLIMPDEAIDKGYEEYLSKFSNLASPYAQITHEPEHTDRRQFVTTYPSRACLHWNPYVDVSSGEEIPIEWSPRRQKLSCNCGNCTSRHCPSRKSSRSFRPIFKDNIMTFSDKCTMTLKVTHASCNATTPLVTPNVSKTSVRSSRSQPKFQWDYTPQYLAPIYRKPCPRSDSYDRRPCHDEAVRDTDLSEDYAAMRNAYVRHHNTSNSGSHGARGAGKYNLYNEGINDKVPKRYPANTVHCPHKIIYGSRAYCMNKCPNCRCREPSDYELMGKESRYHQECKVEYNGPVYYDSSTGNIRRVITPTMYPERFRVPDEKATRTPSIILPKKVLTSARGIEEYVEHKHNCARRSRRKKSK